MVIFLIAAPLTLGSALAAGAPARTGLIAAATGAFASWMLGVSSALSGAVAAGLVLMTAESVQRYGWRITCAAIALVVLGQLAVGIHRVARGILAIPAVVRHGIATGVGVTIALGQLPLALGGGPHPSLPENLAALPWTVAHAPPAAPVALTVVAAASIAWPRLPGPAGRWARKAPAAPAAVLLATAAALVLTGRGLPETGGGLSMLPGLPEGPVLGVFAAVLTIALVVGAQALLTAMGIERLRIERRRADGAGDGGRNAGAGRRSAPRPEPTEEEGRRQAACSLAELLDGLRTAAGRRAGQALLGAGLAGAGLVATGLELTPATVLPAVLPMVLAAWAVVSGLRMAFEGLRKEHPAHRHREFPLYVAVAGVVALVGALEGAALAVVAAAVLAMARNWPAMWSRSEWRARAGAAAGRPDGCRPWTPWRNHQCAAPAAASGAAAGPSGGRQLIGGVSAFQRHTAPLVRDELARLAREGQRPSQLFLTCADSRLVTSMITASGPGDLFTVRNVGNLMPPPGAGDACDSVGAAVEYAVEVLKVGSITVCGHSGCGAMQALLDSADAEGRTGPGNDDETPLARWLRHGRPSLARMRRIGSLGRGEVALAERPVADDVERLALVNVMQQLDNLMAHACVARRVAEGTLHLQGMYFHVGEAQAYVLDRRSRTFSAVRPELLDAVGPAV
ncbi:carbonic anhydrase [Streptomyces sp. NPDC049577]|uniref:carbonic anhydrase n=1 Tax=Streptomyces sp. NPDC049577 TaxID=3155153 RepID=UPI00343EE4F1